MGLLVLTVVGLWLKLCFIFSAYGTDVHDYSIPCIYDGTLKTESDWYGFIANISIMESGRMTFQFSYPAERCCQSILFYLEDQLGVLNTRMNCWQKEALLRHEDDQMLRLTPRFTWSGCHMVHPGGVSTYVCQGGRSFTSNNAETKATSWYLAVSNCASLRGLHLTYHLEVIGHIGACKNLGLPTTPKPEVLTPVLAEPASAQMSNKRCVIEGTLNTTSDWYGYLANLTLAAGGGFKFKFSYKYERQVQNVILYNEHDIMMLRNARSCWEKEEIIRKRASDQIIDLSYRATWNGCKPSNSGQGQIVICEDTRRYSVPRKIFIAVNNCHSKNGLVLKYRFEVFDYEESPCSKSSSIFDAKMHFIILWLSVFLSLFTTKR